MAGATCCLQRGMLPPFRPSQGPSTSYLGWGAGLCVLFQVTRNQPFITRFWKGSSNHLEHRAVPGYCFLWLLEMLVPARWWALCPG